MRRPFIIVVSTVVLVVCLIMSGCMLRRPRPNTMPAVEQGSAVKVAQAIHALSGGELVAELVSTHMRPYFTIGLFLILLGGAAFLLGSRRTGLGLCALGIGLNWLANISLRYPWLNLLAALVAGGLVVCVAYGHWRSSRRQIQFIRDKDERIDEVVNATAILAEVIEALPEGAAIKSAIRERGIEATTKVKKVISPIKETMLARNGDVEAKSVKS